MPCIKDLFLAGLQFASTLLPHHISPSKTSLSHPTQTTSLPTLDPVPGGFEHLLNSLPAESLHAALHAHLPDTFKHGMFESDAHAIEALHSTNPPLATRLVAAARYDLLRRQAGNLTTPTTTPAAPVIVPIPVTSTDAAGSAATSTVTALSAATASVAVALTTTNARGSVLTTSSTVPAVLVTDSRGQISSSPAPTLNPSGVAVLTSTDAAGNTLVSTFTPSAGLVSSLVVETQTAADGSRRTVTSYAVVPASKTQGAGASQTPKLTGAAAPRDVGVRQLLLLAAMLAVVVF